MGRRILRRILEDVYEMELLGKVPEGTCTECATKHKTDQPHNRDSLYYQYNDYNKHGRWPTWKDAWKQKLKEHGIEV